MKWINENNNEIEWISKEAKENLLETVHEEKDNNGYHKRSLTDKLFKERIIFLEGAFDEPLGELIRKQLLVLEADDPEQPITMYINSPGGQVSVGLSILDTMQKINCPVNVCVTQKACSMGAFILAGATGTRSALSNARIMIHQISSGTRGNYDQIVLQQEQNQICHETLTGYMAGFVGMDYDKYMDEVHPKGDNGIWFSAQEALEFGENGLIDKIIEVTPNEKKRMVTPLKPGEKYTKDEGVEK